MRRNLLAASCALLACVSGCGKETKMPDPGASSTSIADENAKPGDQGWRIDDLGADPSFAAFARPLSPTAGQRVDVQVTATAATQVTWKIYRLGYYGGAGGRMVASGGPIAASAQPDPVLDPTTGLVECQWPPSFSVTVGDDWISGLYVVRLEMPDGGARYAPFIVKDARKADVIAVFPTATEEAYNDWGGESLYTDTRFHFPVGHAYQVSYDRPLAGGAGGGGLLTNSLPATIYLEANGYDVTYLADSDVADDGSTLGRGRLTLTLGHDEYWTGSMRDHYEAARDAGVSLGFLGANTAYWQMRLDPAWDGMPSRRQTSYKEAANLDPMNAVDKRQTTGAFRDIGRPENALLGIMSVAWHVIDFPWVVSSSSSWLYRNMGASDGELYPAVVGVESDGVVMNGAAPSNLVVVADSPTISGDSAGVVHQQAAVYETPAGGAVFAAGSIRFPSMLAPPRAQLGPQRIIRNLITRAGAGPALPENTLGAADGFPAPDTSRVASSVSTLAGALGTPGFADGPGTSARFSSPIGLAVLPDGSVAVADPGNRRIRRIPADAAHTVTTIAGSDGVGSQDGPGASASFVTPAGLVAAPDGTLYVSDPHGPAVRAIDPTGNVTTLAGAPDVVEPWGITRASDGTIFVSDVIQNQILAIPPGGKPHPVAINAKPDGDLYFPSGLLADASGLWIVDSGNRLVRHLDASGTLVAAAGSSEIGFLDGAGDQAHLEPMIGIASFGGGLLLTDTGNYRVRLVEPNTTRAQATVRTFAGSAHLSGNDGSGAAAGFVAPTGIAVDVARNIVYVADTGNSTIRAIAP